MDVASVINTVRLSTAQSRTRQYRFSTISSMLSISLLDCSASFAQERLVQVAVEPTLATIQLHLIPVQQKSPEIRNSPEIMEPDRLQPSQQNIASVNEDGNRKLENKKQMPSFLPPQKPIGQINIDLRSKPKGGSNVVPENFADMALGQSGTVHASMSQEMNVAAVASRSQNHDDLFAHQPLYFEEVNVERYGRSCGRLQPAISGLRFFATIPTLPYAMTLHPPRKPETVLWPYPAGWGAPKVQEIRPLEVKPSLVQAGAVTGLLFVLP